MHLRLKRAFPWLTCFHTFLTILGWQHDRIVTSQLLDRSCLLQQLRSKLLQQLGGIGDRLMTVDLLMILNTESGKLFRQYCKLAVCCSEMLARL